tara:strand:+ start:610 stop:999 length:390 start_codon:yes stop_codon:yes gene_type:complete
MRVYAIILIQEGANLDYGIEPIGMYSTLELALEYIEKLEEVTPENDCMYDVFEFAVDEKPLMLEFLEKRTKFQKEAVEEVVIDLMKKGLVDQLVGEDGNFYYTLTKLGEKLAKEDIPEHVRKFFKKRKK